MKRNFLVYIILISLMLVLFANFASATNQTDNLTSDVLQSDEVKTFTSIQSEVSKAKADDTIYLDGYYVSEGKKISIDKSLTFEGRNNAVLDANHKDSIFYAPNPVTLTFKNITFINSYNYAIGTNDMIGPFNVNIYNCNFKNNHFIAVQCYNDHVKIENSVFEDNYEGLISYSHPVIINNCNFTNNYYAAMEISDGTVSNSYFYKNGNSDNGVGAIFARNLKVSNSRFVKNLSYRFGAAIYCDYEGDISISNSSFSNNAAKLLGGAVYAGWGVITVSGSEFIDNTAYNGAAIFSDKANLYVSNSSFTENYGNFATVYIGGYLKATDSTFKYNSKYSIIASRILLVNCNSISKNINRWVSLDDNLVESDFIRIVVNKIDTTYYSGKKLTVQLINTKDNSPVKNCKVKVTLKLGKKTYTKYLTTNKKGFASFDVSKYKIGMYSIFVSVSDSRFSKISIDNVDVGYISQAPTTVKAPKVKFKYKKSKYFKVTIKNKKTKKPVAKLKLKLKIYTGKKYKIYKVTTNKKGVAKFNTKKLKRGKHKVVISSANVNYEVNKKSLIRIR